MSANRTHRIGERIQHELARLIREELRDPRVGFVTLTGVEVSTDLRHAKVYLSVLGDGIDGTLAALDHATPFLRHALARTAGLKHTPTLRFFEDRSLARARRVEELLDDWSDGEGEGEDEDG